MKRICTVAVVFLMIFVLVGCKEKLEDKIANEILEKSLEESGIADDVEVSKDGKVIKIETEGGEINLEEGQGWPEAMPDDIPVFEGGEIAAYSGMGDQFALQIHYDDSSDYENYIEALLTA